MVRLARSARLLTASVQVALVLPVAFAVVALLCGAWYPPEAIAAGAHWDVLGWSPPPCPGCGMCGMSRAFSALLHGRLGQAWAFNPAVVLVFPAVLGAAVVAGTALWRFWQHPLRLDQRGIGEAA
ncbi:MAG: DUF2752 domain-containing protein [Polyangiaceae bacterium]